MDNNDTDRPSAAVVRSGPGASGGDNTGSSITSNGVNYALNGKIMLCTVVILFVVVIIVLAFHTYARWLFTRRTRRRSRGGLPLHRSAAAAAKSGLDVAVLKSLPTFTFHAAAVGGDDNNPGDCPVCISGFEDGETGRALPKCGHTFHAECIDMWLATHSNCPLCRAPVQAQPDSNAAPLVAPATALPPGQGSESGGSVSLNSPIELVAISVETPPSMEERFRDSMEELGSGSGGGNRVKSPGKPVLSMKRIWSV